MEQLIGRRFGRLEVIEQVGSDIRGRLFDCRCKCGEFIVVPAGILTRGHRKSCGCMRREYLAKQRKIMALLNRSHGMYKSREYHIWQCMKDRCLNPKSKAFCDYGGRGITVCERWMTFVNFYDDMGDKPAKRSLDRIDNNGGYRPDNCRWATHSQQMLNRRPPGTGRRMRHSQAN